MSNVVEIRKETLFLTMLKSRMVFVRNRKYDEDTKKMKRLIKILCTGLADFENVIFAFL